MISLTHVLQITKIIAIEKKLVVSKFREKWWIAQERFFYW
jgi:hypothetical protein